MIHANYSPNSLLPSLDNRDRYVRGMELLVEVVQKLSLARDLDTIVEIVRKAARQLTQADGATFVLKDGDLCYYVDEDAVSPLWKGQRFLQSICIGGWCMRNRQTVAIEDVYGDERIPIAAYRPTFIKSLVMVPIRIEDPIGAVGNYWAEPHAATPEEIRLLQALADTTSVALENVRVYQELEQRVSDRTRELQNTNQELQAFAYTLSHDLRTPLTIIKGFSDLLHIKCAAQLSVEGKKYVDRIEGGVTRINNLIEGMLLLHQVKQAKLQFQTVNLSDIAREILANLQAESPARPVETSIADSLIVQGDPVLLRVALENLLSNAWKYSIKKSRTRIEFGCTEDPAAFYIKDNGVGFDPKDAGKLFRPFQRLHDDREFSGNGIGLASVARIIERHSGKIWAEATLDRGATFFFILPITP